MGIRCGASVQEGSYPTPQSIGLDTIPTEDVAYVRITCGRKGQQYVFKTHLSVPIQVGISYRGVQHRLSLRGQFRGRQREGFGAIDE